MKIINETWGCIISQKIRLLLNDPHHLSFLSANRRTGISILWQRMEIPECSEGRICLWHDSASLRQE